MMRIITGKAKGIKLKTLEGMTTRPTAERVKEAVFSALQFDIEGRKVLDLFAGSGQMALEAVSRGATAAVLVDKSIDAIKTIKENTLRTGLADSCLVYNCDALDFLKRLSKDKFDIVFIDPPYASDLYHSILDGLLVYGAVKPTSIIVCESDSDIVTAELLEKYELLKSNRYGRIHITMLKPLIT